MNLQDVFEILEYIDPIFNVDVFNARAVETGKEEINIQEFIKNVGRYVVVKNMMPLETNYIQAMQLLNGYVSGPSTINAIHTGCGTCGGGKVL